jgi:glycine/D-amino acid oxidase-like deaminating enzyme
MRVVENPFFKDIPVIPNKGHHIKVKLQNELNTKVTVKKKHFLFPLNDELYFYGGTYDRDQLHSKIDDSAVKQLMTGLSEIYSQNFEVKDVSFGFRPTVKDRRPILGRHPEFKDFYVFNGLGARGILNGCYFSKNLLEFIENNTPLPEEVSLERFNDK